MPGPGQRAAADVLDDDRVVVGRREVAVVVAARPPVEDRLRGVVRLGGRRGRVAQGHVLEALEGLAARVAAPDDAPAAAQDAADAGDAAPAEGPVVGQRGVHAAPVAAVQADVALVAEAAGAAVVARVRGPLERPEDRRGAVLVGRGQVRPAALNHHVLKSSVSLSLSMYGRVPRSCLPMTCSMLECEMLSTDI